MSKGHSGQRPPAETRKREFCSQSCATTFNNKGTRRGPRPQPRLCVCGTPCKHPSRYCCAICKETTKEAKERLFAQTTKGELFSQRPTWQAARSVIQGHARRVFFAATPKPQCAICAYTLHIEVAHRRSVADFPCEAKVFEINDLVNLIALCPTHHWEFDNGHRPRISSQSFDTYRVGP